MPPKAKESAEKVPVLKGKEAEDRVLAYLKKMNRPYGAVDVCANLKGAIPKATTQKILAALAEKGEITQKAYGKTTLFVSKQDKIEDVNAEKLTALESECKALDESKKILEVEVKSASAELSRIKKTPTDEELIQQTEEANAAVQKLVEHLTPLRAGTPLISTAEIAQLDADWTKWRTEWVSRKKIFNNLWHLVTDSLPPQDAADLAENLGIELDTAEHEAIERGPLCAPKRR